YLMHWPVTEKRQDSWRAMTEIYRSGRAKAVGVSNFLVRHLEELSQTSDLVPAVNQVEFHPFLYDELIGLLDYCKQKGIVFEAYSPLAHGKVTDTKVLPVIAKNHDKSTAQVILRWCLQHGTVPLPKSTDPEHIRQNLEIFDFGLTAAEMEQINDLSNGTRTAWNPENLP
ncbi:MAG TPA: aldo/keto reductase, partial [Candidatus Saccharimonadales bacterium]|nr:aldo/keto reductase [Candidatus Saccharimonadales bacterium]